MSDVKRYWVPTLPGRLTRDCVEVVTARDHVAEVERLKTLHVKQLSEVVERMADDHCVVVERLRGLLHDWREQWGDGMHPDGDLIDATDAALASTNSPDVSSRLAPDQPTDEQGRPMTYWGGLADQPSSALGKGVKGVVGSARSDECPAEGVARAEVVPYPYGEGRTDQPTAAHEHDWRPMQTNDYHNYCPACGARQHRATGRITDPTTEILSTTAKGG